jgi:hypothetical protein
VIYSFSQEKYIEEIRERYTSIQQTISEEMMQPVVLNFDINRPAIGMQSVSTKFYWNNWSSEYYDRDENGEVYYKITRELSMVISEYNIAASSFYHHEYVYDDQGKLIFYYKRIVEENVKELRLYFHNGELIKEISRVYEKTEDNANGNIQDEKTNISGFSVEIKNQMEEAKIIAEKYLGYFKVLFEIEGLK